ncbi:MAG TPA: alpha-glucan family phosphorylase, partial [Planctomycetota bacterium]|nr:alpha-glucan family phosphorylase [Planctomycetota bacterium]
AYFCAEFGVHESLPIYNGGLGVLAGDHLKAASDLAFPLVGVGLFYRRGYLRQRVSVLGDQVPLPVENEPRDLPMDLVRDAKGRALTVELDLPGTRLTLVAWRVMVGRVPLYLLDADLPENRPEDRAITRQLYGGDQEHRLRQEIVLGKGGMRLLHRLGIEPCAVHMNEGHATFAPLERVSRLVHQAGLTFDEAAEVVRATTVFTTHTPVPAGHDRFPEALLRRYFSDSAAWVGLPWERFLALGQAGAAREFNMTYLGLRMSAVHNGVSRLHGVVSRRLLGPFWPGLLEEEVPVVSVTNGVHLPTWTAPTIQRLLGVEGRPVAGGDFRLAAPSIDATALWGARREARARLLADVKALVRAGCEERHEPPDVRATLRAGLVPDALVIGFARRFATYKRADLLLRDVKRLERLVGDAGRPVRILYAGKAHPEDGAGQDLLRKIVKATREPGLIGRLYFLDDYDMELARRLVQGVDVWLNTPVRGMEASGTSGMKATANGAIHLSVRDGWWDEGHDAEHGWAVGEGPMASTREVEDDLDAAALYRLLEEEVVPEFFDRDQDGVPRRWVERVRRSLTRIPPVFDARRMVGEYWQMAYLPLATAWLDHATSGWAHAKDLAARHGRVRRAFGGVRLHAARMDGLAGLAAGGSLEVSADVDLAGLSPDDVLVELVFRGTGPGAPKSRVASVLSPAGEPRGTVLTYRGSVTVDEPGRQSGAFRVRARADRQGDGGLADLVVWA